MLSIWQFLWVSWIYVLYIFSICFRRITEIGLSPLKWTHSAYCWKRGSEPGKNLDPSLALNADESPSDGSVLGDGHRPHMLFLLTALDALWSLCLSSFGCFYFVASLLIREAFPTTIHPFSICPPVTAPQASLTCPCGWRARALFQSWPLTVRRLCCRALDEMGRIWWVAWIRLDKYRYRQSKRIKPLIYLGRWTRWTSIYQIFFWVQRGT